MYSMFNLFLVEALSVFNFTRYRVRAPLLGFDCSLNRWRALQAGLVGYADDPCRLIWSHDLGPRLMVLGRVYHGISESPEVKDRLLHPQHSEVFYQALLAFLFQRVIKA